MIPVYRGWKDFYVSISILDNTNQKRAIVQNKYGFSLANFPKASSRFCIDSIIISFFSHKPGTRYTIRISAYHPQTKDKSWTKINIGYFRSLEELRNYVKKEVFH